MEAWIVWRTLRLQYWIVVAQSTLSYPATPNPSIWKSGLILKNWKNEKSVQVMQNNEISTAQ